MFSLVRAISRERLYNKEVPCVLAHSHILPQVENVCEAVKRLRRKLVCLEGRKGEQRDKTEDDEGQECIR